MTEKRLYVFGIPYMRHHLAESLMSAVCEATLNGFHCTKEHLRQFLNGGGRSERFAVYVNAAEGALRHLSSALLAAMVVGCTLVTLSETLCACGVLLIPAYVLWRLALRERVRGAPAARLAGGAGGEAAGDAVFSATAVLAMAMCAGRRRRGWIAWSGAWAGRCGSRWCVKAMAVDVSAQLGGVEAEVEVGVLMGGMVGLR